MALVSSHILDSVNGRSAAGIRCQLLQLQRGEPQRVVFDVMADHEGRISETVRVGADELGGEFELVLHAANSIAKIYRIPASRSRNAST